MELTQSILTKNPCYTAGRKITVKGLMLHSVGCPQPSAAVFIKNWNKPSFKNACVHGFIDGNTGVVYQTLPWNHRGWHGGGKSNNTHIGVEMCEPSTIKYVGGATFKDNDPANTRTVVLRTYRAAVELFAMLCKEFNLDPLADGVIISHKEGHKRGIASNHGDPDHLFKHVGLSMNGFRKDVSEELKKAGVVIKPVETVKPQQNSNTLMVGTEVDFTGDKHYNSSYGSAVARKCKPGKATITMAAPGKPHPYHCVAVNGKGATVHGWVDAADVKVIERRVIKKGDVVKVIKPITYTGGTFKVYYDTYDVIQVNGDRAVIGKGKTVAAAVKASNLQLVD